MFTQEESNTMFQYNEEIQDKQENFLEELDYPQQSTDEASHFQQLHFTDVQISDRKHPTTFSQVERQFGKLHLHTTHDIRSSITSDNSEYLAEVNYPQPTNYLVTGRKRRRLTK